MIECMNQRANERTDKRTNERIIVSPNERTSRRTSERSYHRTNEQTNEQTNKRTNEQTNKRTHEHTNALTHERTNEQMGRWIGKSTSDGRTNEPISIEVQGDGRVCKQMNKYVRECLSMLIVRCHIILTISWVISTLWKYFLGWIQSDCLKGNCWSRDELKKFFKD